MTVQEVSEEGECKVTESFVGDQEDFKRDSVLDRQPVEVLEDWSDVVPGAGVSEQKGSQVLDVLEFVFFFEEFGGCTVQNAVSVVQL